MQSLDITTRHYCVDYINKTLDTFLQMMLLYSAMYYLIDIVLLARQQLLYLTVFTSKSFVSSVRDWMIIHLTKGNDSVILPS